MLLLAESFLTAQSSAVYSQYAFAMYGIAVQATGARANIAPAYHPGHSMPLGHDLTAMCAMMDADTRLIYIANPNNPTGTWNTAEQLRTLLERVPHGSSWCWMRPISNTRAGWIARTG